MISYQFPDFCKPLQRVMHDTPKPQGTEVLVRVTRSGVCHSDLHIWDGYFELGGGKRFYVKERGCVPPFTLGHEPLGIVEDFGSSVSRIDKKIKRGQKRIVFPWIGCGRCAICKSGQDNYCVSGSRFLGINRPGAYASHVLVPHPKYLVDSSGIDDAFAAALGIGALRKGGRYVICGLFGGELVHPLPPIAQRAIGIAGSYVGNLQELKEVVALAKRKKLKPAPVSVRPADQVTAILEDLKAGKILGRVVLAF